MTFYEYWNALLVQNPKLDKHSDETVTLKVGGLHNIVKQAFAMGEKHKASKKSENSNFNDIFPWLNHK